jgi:hypothetical protein
MVRRCRRGALDNGWADRLQGPICPANRLLVRLAARLSMLSRAWPEHVRDSPAAVCLDSRPTFS